MDGLGKSGKRTPRYIFPEDPCLEKWLLIRNLPIPFQYQIVGDRSVAGGEAEAWQEEPGRLIR